MFIALAALIVMTAFLLGYVLGRKHRRETAREALAVGDSSWLVRPHTESTVEEYPLPDLENPNGVEVGDSTFNRTDFPNSGVRWN